MYSKFILHTHFFVGFVPNVTNKTKPNLNATFSQKILLLFFFGENWKENFVTRPYLPSQTLFAYFLGFLPQETFSKPV